MEAKSFRVLGTQLGQFGCCRQGAILSPMLARKIDKLIKGLILIHEVLKDNHFVCG